MPFQHPDQADRLSRMKTEATQPVRGIGTPPPLWRDPELLAGGLLLLAALIVGLVTAPDYGITTDEFVFDPYGPKALAWYTSGFTDGTVFTLYDVYMEGAWFQMLVALAQSLHVAAPFTVRHALSFAVGLAGLAALLPIGRIAVGRWAGLIAVVLCLTTGYLYGHLFFSPNDSPFLAAMTWATLAILKMAERPIPAWPATVAAGFFTGLAIATRFGGVLAQAYLVGAMVLCTLDGSVLARERRLQSLGAIGVRTLTALAIGWLAAIALWPWLQAPNPLARYLEVYRHFVRSYLTFDFLTWGHTVSSAALPWHYIPGQLLARLPEGFVALLIIAALFGAVALVRFLRDCTFTIKQHGAAGIAVGAAELAQSRRLLIVTAAALVPPVFIVVRGSVIFDGIRHVLFTVPMLAVLAAWALSKLAPLLLRLPAYAATIAALHVVPAVATMIYLHPLEYIAMNAFAGGVPGAYGRFDLDYWSAAATEAVRRLEARLTKNPPARFAARAPRVLVCIGWRQEMVGPMFSRPWRVETDPAKADFIIETERTKCRPDHQGSVIDEVQRFGRTFAQTIAMPPAP
jgi:hypothetical protein